ncbi:Ribosomal RNA small subunit methyltransferase E [Armadillidium vulgare]|nr:Ribosomal RNA small subunit methyltransferase E [Armadillidium vulgare] [Wolbachia endosymbiont of Armadillidium vulgare]
MRKIRLYVGEALSQDVSLALNSQQSHYICNVMRLKKHDNLSLFNGKDGEWLGEVVNVSRKLTKVTLKECTKQQQYEENLYLYCAMVKSGALGNIVRQATEMGVTCIQFISTERTVVKNINLSRAKLQAIEAAEQSGLIFCKLSSPSLTELCLLFPPHTGLSDLVSIIDDVTSL